MEYAILHHITQMLESVSHKWNKTKGIALEAFWHSRLFFIHHMHSVVFLNPLFQTWA